MVNPSMIFRMKSMWDAFISNHPKLPRFFRAVLSRPMEEGTIIELIIRHPNGDELASNVKLTASDLELIEQLKEMGTDGSRS
ncbi:MAG: hypothetical protein HFH35_05990 [Eubacterium sp.]|nr:hypothetical protein [Eubacterium sp.]